MVLLAPCASTRLDEAQQAVAACWPFASVLQAASDTGISRALETLVLVPAHGSYGMSSYRPSRTSREATAVGVPTKRAQGP